MPSWSNVISTNELNDLADYLFSLKPKGDNLGFSRRFKRLLL